MATDRVLTLRPVSPPFSRRWGSWSPSRLRAGSPAVSPFLGSFPRASREHHSSSTEEGLSCEHNGQGSYVRFTALGGFRTGGERQQASTGDAVWTPLLGRQGREAWAGAGGSARRVGLRTSASPPALVTWETPNVPESSEGRSEEGGGDQYPLTEGTCSRAHVSWEMFVMVLCLSRREETQEAGLRRVLLSVCGPVLPVFPARPSSCPCPQLLQGVLLASAGGG